MQSTPRIITAMSALLTSCALTPPPQAPDTTSDLAQCPNLAGTYLEEGIETDRKGVKPPRPVHLSWIILGGSGIEYPPVRPPLASGGGPNNPMKYFARTLVVSHPTRDVIQFQAFDENGIEIGTYRVGPERHWFCRASAFVQASSRRFEASELYPVDVVFRRTLQRAGDGSLVISEYDSRQQLGYIIQTPDGPPYIRDTEEVYKPVTR